MRIVTLVENTSSSPEYKHKHGLSLYIETSKHKILFDLGSDDLFLQNAEKLHVDIAAVDTVVISHGHFDHGGALRQFLQNNNTARVYIRKTAFEKYCTKLLGFPISIGLDETLKNDPQLLLTDEEYIIDNEIRLFSDVRERECYSSSNKALYVKTASGLKLDEFGHEQNLLISENGIYTLIAGCAHNGIINIQNKAEQLIGRELNYVISGFHLFNPTNKKSEDNELLQEIANRLKAHQTRYYTCHCTGIKAFQFLNNAMKEQIAYLSTGCSIEL
jgi:7,8-dihydropterin-6-yl-methyl-4-(beta-D-ribofuranosyl)aminobenzene 5'-phosphate synthase